MHVFVTGGTGLIGSAVVAGLLGNGHTVLALARSDASALAVEAAGAETLRGGLADLNILRAKASSKDKLTVRVATAEGKSNSAGRGCSRSTASTPASASSAAI